MKKTFSFATNFSVDLLGEIDTRENCWGRAESCVKKIQFVVPPRKRVRILKVYGDFIAWPIGVVEPGKCAGALFGLQTTAKEGSTEVDYGANNTFVYLQVAMKNEPARAAFDFDVCAGGLLEDDGTLVVKIASWLNDTELKIHAEPSFVVVYEYTSAR